MSNLSPLLAALQSQCDATPDAPAVFGPDGLLLDYAAVADMVRQTGQACDDLGLKSSHRIATLLPDTADTALFLLGASARLSVMPLNSALTDGELIALVERGQVDAVIALGDDAQAVRLAHAVSLPLIPLDALLGREHTQIDLPASGHHQAGLTLLTSGSTGLPKMVRISPIAMLASARNIIATLDLGAEDRALHALPMFHIGAVVDLLLVPLLSGGSTVICPGRTPSDLLGAVTTQQATWMQLVPTMLTRCMAECDAIQLAQFGESLAFVRMVSADLSADLQSRAETALGTPLIQMYGMTETAGQICSNPRPPAESRATSVGLVAGPEVAILDATGGKLAQGREGEVCVRGETVFDGYEGHERGDAFFNDWFRTGDLGRFDSDGYLFLTGRKKEMINQGGEKISPLEIERVALALEGVTEVAAYPLPHPTLGEQTGLSVVTALSSDNVMDHLKGHLAHYKLPRKIDMRDALPRLGGGKVDKLRLIRESQSGDPVQASHWDGQALVIAQIWADVLKTEIPAAETDFFDAGGDSLSATTFIIAMEDRLQTQIDPNILFNHPTFGALVDNLSDSGEPATDVPSVFSHMRRLMAGWPGELTYADGLIRSLGTASDGHPVFWCGTSSHQGLALQKALGFGHPVHTMVSALHFPGRTETDREVAADILTAEINRIQPEGPLIIGGFCEGGHGAERIANRMIAAGREVSFVISGDFWFSRPTAFPVIHMFFEYRATSRTTLFAHPEMAFPVLHPAGAVGFRMKGGHKFDENQLDGMVDDLQAYVSGRKRLTPFAQNSVPLDDRPALYDASLSVQMPRFCKPDTPFQIVAEITNQSGMTWEPTAQSGLGIVVHARNFDNHARQFNMAFGQWDTPVPSGATVQVTMNVRYPDVRLPLKMQVILCDQGIMEMPKTHAAHVSRIVWPKLF